MVAEQVVASGDPGRVSGLRFDGGSNRGVERGHPPPPVEHVERGHLGTVAGRARTPASHHTDSVL